MRSKFSSFRACFWKSLFGLCFPLLRSAIAILIYELQQKLDDFHRIEIHV